MAVLNALKKRWLGPVAARVALERVRKRLKHCLGRVAARVALEACGKEAARIALKACGRV